MKRTLKMAIQALIAVVVIILIGASGQWDYELEKEYQESVRNTPRVNYLSNL